MEKIHVIDEREGSEVPFLRGILTRSLQRSGVPFDDAYEISDKVRHALAQRSKISSSELRGVVSEYLQSHGYDKQLRAYQEGALKVSTIHIIDRDGSEVPFSKGRLSQSMEICGMDQDQSYQITQSIQSVLNAEKRTEISSPDLADRAFRAIRMNAGDEIAIRYQQWREFGISGKPLILLIGGTTGSGKSTIGSELAHRLDIVRTQSTDMLREVMRLMIPARLLPTLHTSSFAAYKMFPQWESEHKGMEEPSMIAGYLSQAEQVGVGIEGVLKRAENERVSLILEGVHAHPALQQQIADQSYALVVPIILAVLKKKRLRRRLVGRGQAITSRRSERYLENFDHIWNLQSFLLDEADHFNIPIIQNLDEDEAIRSIMQTISVYVAREISTRTEVSELKSKSHEA
ncbi:MAG: 2-phosphoglycerate kinase [Rhodothermia bacterium]|nr:MAG: 2-phosphoglycerate kinase [Rhodothermia bacterium]